MIDLVKAGALFDDIISKLTKKDYEDWLLMDNKRIFENLKVGLDIKRLFLELKIILLKQHMKDIHIQK